MHVLRALRDNKIIVEVTIPQGVVHGTVQLGLERRKYYSFQGIPYGKPPIGNLRFKAPEPADKFDDNFFDATYPKNVAPASHYEPLIRFTPDEDCLSLNVYSPATLKSELLPVMVNIHGGAFLSGTAHKSERGPELIIDKNVVLVTVEFRLGVLGFLRLNDVMETPGNAGLKDVVLALHWINENISFFKGDPENVTVFGTGSGGAIAHLLTFSPLATGLFHKVIVQTGCALSPWVFVPRIDSKVASLCGYKGVSQSMDVYNFLKTLPTDKLVEAQSLIFNDEDLFGREGKIIGPVIERRSADAFLQEHPLNLLRCGEFNKVPMMLGFLKNDARLAKVYSTILTDPNHIDNMLVPKAVRELYYDSRKIDKVKKLMKYYYVNYFNADGVTRLKDIYNQITNDIGFSCGIRKSVKEHSKYSDVYYYTFGLITRLNARIGQLTHGDEERYLLSKPGCESWLQYGETEYKWKNIMTTMWTNFAKTGNPNPIMFHENNPVWEPVIGDLINYLDIDYDLHCGMDPYRERIMNLNKIIFNTLYADRPPSCDCKILKLNKY